MKQLNLCVLLINFVLVHQSCATTYWKDYLGKVPEDAVPGGTERGITTYIGQALHELPNGKLIPGPIDDTKKHMTYNWDGKSYVTTKNIKILCSQHHDKVTWIDTDNTASKLIDERILVRGGYDTSYPLYIGKIHVDNDYQLGKVTIEKPYDQMCYVSKEKADCTKKHYLILTYKL